MSLTGPTRAMRLVSGRACVPAWLWITAAMVIAQPVFLRVYLHFSALPDLCKEMSTKSNDNAAGARRKRPHLRAGVVIREWVLDGRGVAARLFQRLRAPDCAAPRRIRRYFA